MLNLLQKCTTADFAVLISRIRGVVNLSADKELAGLLANLEEDESDENRLDLAKAVEREVRYLGSADVAYAYRKLASTEDPAGVGIHEIIDDVSTKLKVKQKLVGGVEAKIERLVRAVVEKTFFAMTDDEQRKLFAQSGVGQGNVEDLFQHLKNNKAQLLPLLLSTLGPEVTLVLVQSLAVTALAAFIGRKAAEELFKNLAARFPWWAEWLGPIVWGVSLTWLAFDLQGPASRKTIPILLYLGIVALRDGPEDGAAFWEDEGYRTRPENRKDGRRRRKNEPIEHGGNQPKNAAPVLPSGPLRQGHQGGCGAGEAR